MRTPTVVVLLLGALLATASCRKTAADYDNATQLTSAMGKLSKAKQYDSAIRIGQEWLRAHPNNSTVHEQIGMTFLIEASADPSQRAYLLNRASEYFDNSIRLAPDDPLGIFNAAWGFEAAGDLSSGSERCELYAKAQTALAAQEALVVGDAPHAHDSSAVPLRKANNEAVTRLAGKVGSFHCEQTRISK